MEQYYDDTLLLRDIWAIVEEYRHCRVRKRKQRDFEKEDAFDIFCDLEPQSKELKVEESKELKVEESNEGKIQFCNAKAINMLFDVIELNDGPIVLTINNTFTFRGITITELDDGKIMALYARIACDFVQGSGTVILPRQFSKISQCVKNSTFFELTFGLQNKITIKNDDGVECVFLINVNMSRKWPLLISQYNYSREYIVDFKAFATFIEQNDADSLKIETRDKFPFLIFTTELIFEWSSTKGNKQINTEFRLPILNANELINVHKPQKFRLDLIQKSVNSMELLNPKTISVRLCENHPIVFIVDYDYYSKFTYICSPNKY